MGLCIFHTFAQCLVDIGGNGSFGRREQCVATRTGETVVIPHYGALNNSDVEPKMFHHRLDDGNLLPVLLAKICLARTDNIK